MQYHKYMTMFTWFANWWAIRVATRSWSKVDAVDSSYSRPDSWYEMKPQFSIAPTLMSGKAIWSVIKQILHVILWSLSLYALILACSTCSI